MTARAMATGARCARSRPVTTSSSLHCRMRFSFMRFVPFVLVAASGCACSGLSIPFDGGTGGKIALPLGVVSESCSGEGSDVRDNGDVVTRTHTLSGTRCTITATWSGTLVDMARVRDDAEDEMREEGVDPQDVSVRIDDVETNVTSVGLRDGNQPLAIDGASGLVTYQASVLADGE